MSSRKIVFYDGDCGVCNGLVQFLLARDGGRFHYAPLQGVTAKAHFGGAPDLNTMRFVDGKTAYERSEAVLRIAIELGWPWKMAGVFRIIPRFLRDAAYDAFAKRRQSFATASCRLATPEERRRFLD